MYSFTWGGGVGSGAEGDGGIVASKLRTERGGPPRGSIS